MEKKNNFLTFLLALIPGIGYMYLGLIIKGAETLVIYMLIDPIFKLVGISFLAGIVKLLFWAITFVNTMSTAKKMDNGEVIEDEDFILKKFSKEPFSGSVENTNSITYKLSKNGWTAAGWILVIVGLLALINKIFYYSPVYEILRSYLNIYFIPVAFIIIGVYLLIRSKK